MSDNTRTLVCIFAVGDPKQELPRLDVNWDHVFQSVARNGLIGLTFHYLEHHATLDYPPPEFRRLVRQAHRSRALGMARLYQNINHVLRGLNDRGIDTLVVKGPALAYGIYPNPTLRSFNDLDVVVRERDWSTVYRLLAELGFQQQENLPQPPPKPFPKHSPYESKYWHTKTRFLVEVHYEDLFNVGLASRDVEGFWNRAVKIDVDRLPIQIPSLEDQLIHACMHAHYHGYTRLHWFSDLAFIVRNNAHRLGWERVIEIAHVEQVQVGVYYSLHFLGRLLGVGVPEHALNAMLPDRFRRWWHARFLPEQSVISLQPMRRPDFSFYFIPLFKRLMPDLLVMGRRREKLGYLLRYWFPPKDWLRYYYNITDHRPLILALNYVLHPIKLIAHYFAEIIRLGQKEPSRSE